MLSSVDNVCCLPFSLSSPSSFLKLLRDGPLETLWGGGGGGGGGGGEIFEPQEFFFVSKFFVGIFFRP